MGAAAHPTMNGARTVELKITLMISRMMPNDRVERPTTMTVPRPDAAHDASRSARTCC